MKKYYKRYIKLGWELIEHKIRYYIFSNPVISDNEYDNLELEYLKLCMKYKLENTVVHKLYPNLVVNGEGMMEVDMTRPSVQLVYNKLIGRAL